MHILSGKSKSIDISTSREGGEREMCVLFEFRHFLIYVFTLLDLSTKLTEISGKLS